MTRRTLIVAMSALGALLVCALAALAILAFTRVSNFAHDESVQRVHTIGERCEQEEHQAEEHGPQEAWFLEAQVRCRVSLAKVEARAGVHYVEPK